MFNLDTIKNLYYAYSPLKSNRELEKNYITTTHNEAPSNVSIRTHYNDLILKNFLNESVIKAAFIQKYSFQKSPDSNVTAFEINVGGSRADLCLLNGKSVVYEIKTEFDTFNRLESQLLDYRKTFEYIYLIIPKSKLGEALSYLTPNDGIIIYSQNRHQKILFKVYKDAIINPLIDSRFQLKQLTKAQLYKLTGEKNGDKNVLVDNILSSHTADEINKIYIDFIKLKFKKRWTYLYHHRNHINPLDYQWFFKNNIDSSIIYR